jgi:hypothetical protein
MVDLKGPRDSRLLPGLCDDPEKIYSEAITIASKAVTPTSHHNFLTAKLAMSYFISNIAKCDDHLASAFGFVW